MQAVAEYKSDEFVSSAKMKSNLRRQEKKQAASDVKRNNSLVMVERKKERIALGADNQLFDGKKKSLELVVRAFAPKPLKSERFRP